jgi:hypothetical protein
VARNLAAVYSEAECLSRPRFLNFFSRPEGGFAQNRPKRTTITAAYGRRALRTSAAANIAPRLKPTIHAAYRSSITPDGLADRLPSRYDQGDTLKELANGRHDSLVSSNHALMAGH